MTLETYNSKNGVDGARVLQEIDLNPKINTWKIVDQLNISQNTVWKRY